MPNSIVNSIVDDGNAHNMFASTFSFDDASSALSEREDFMLTLVSSLTGTTTSQGRNQKRALTILKACGVQPEVLDAADPENTFVCEELCEMSGLRGVFPQFFLVQGDKTSYFADFDELEHMNDEGTLAEWLSMELPITKLLLKNNKEANGGNASTNTPVNNDDRSRISQSHSIQDDENANSAGIESDNEYAGSSNTEDLLNITSVFKILKSFDTNNIVPDEHLEDQAPRVDGNNSEIDDDKKNMILSVPSTSTAQDEWSDPLLQQQYEDEILALEDFLQEEGEQHQQQQWAQTRFEENKEEMQGVSGERVHETPNLQSSISSRINRFESTGKKENNDGKKMQKGGRHCDMDKHNSISSLSSAATTAITTPTSSSSLSPESHRLHTNSIVNNLSPPPLSCHKNKTNDKENSCNVSTETVSTRAETEQLLQAEIEELRRNREKLTAERYIMEGQLKEARQRSKDNEERSSEWQNIGTVHKYQLQQSMTCSSCTEVFKSNPSSGNAPIASQSCGHSICRNCCHKRFSAVRRLRDENTVNSSDFLRDTISSDLFMCGMGKMSQVYAPSVDERQRQLKECESCPICSAPRAFRHGKLCVNESLCIVLKLLDN
jgi:FtsZ-binding cell division protein ZapB